MVHTVARLREIADDFERRGKITTDVERRAEMVDIAVKARFLISEIAKLFDEANEIEAT